MDRNEIEFDYTRGDDHEPFEVVVRIDGTDLTELIDVLHDVVVWDFFEQPYRPERDYTGFGPFRFDRHRYDKAAAALAAAVESPPE